MAASIVDRDRVSHHLREDHRSAAPGANHLLLFFLIHGFDTLEQFRLNVRVPFFNDRDISAYLIYLAVRLAATTHNVLIRLLIKAGLLTQGRLTPRTLRTGETNRLAAFTTTMWMVAGAHSCTANRRANAEVALATGFTKFDIAVVEIADLANGRVTNLMDETNFTRGHTDLGKIAFFGKQLCRASSRTDHLPPLPGFISML
jgi:hypothetical protein